MPVRTGGGAVGEGEGVSDSPTEHSLMQGSKMARP